MSTLNYGRTRQLAGLKFEQALELVVAALRRVNLQVLAKLDVGETLRSELGVALERYVILGVGNATLTYRALQLDSQAGLALPCRVVVREGAERGIVVSVEDPRAVFALVGSDVLHAVANEIAEMLDQFLESLA